MFPVKEYDCITTQDKLLYNIWQALQPVQNATEQPKKEDVKVTDLIGTCPVCGKEWGNNGQRLACVRKHKKEGK